MVEGCTAFRYIEVLLYQQSATGAESRRKIFVFSISETPLIRGHSVNADVAAESRLKPNLTKYKNANTFDKTIL